MPKTRKIIFQIDGVLSNLEKILSGEFKDIPSYFHCNWVSFGSGFSKFHSLPSKIKNPRFFPSDFLLTILPEEYSNEDSLIAREYLRCDGMGFYRILLF